MHGMQSREPCVVSKRASSSPPHSTRITANSAKTESPDVRRVQDGGVSVWNELLFIRGDEVPAFVVELGKALNLPRVVRRGPAIERLLDAPAIAIVGKRQLLQRQPRN